jgi:hypothetical protein
VAGGWRLRSPPWVDHGPIWLDIAGYLVMQLLREGVEVTRMLFKLRQRRRVSGGPCTDRQAQASDRLRPFSESLRCHRPSHGRGPAQLAAVAWILKQDSDPGPTAAAGGPGPSLVVPTATVTATAAAAAARASAESASSCDSD